MWRQLTNLHAAARPGSDVVYLGFARNRFHLTFVYTDFSLMNSEELLSAQLGATSQPDMEDLKWSKKE